LHSCSTRAHKASLYHKKLSLSLKDQKDLFQQGGAIVMPMQDDGAEQTGPKERSLPHPRWWPDHQPARDGMSLCSRGGSRWFE